MKRERIIEISLAAQRLWLREGTDVLMDVRISSAKNGPGERIDSECTPRGWHRIHAKIGTDCPINSVFVGRKPTGEIYSKEHAAAAPGRDWILTRIVWLDGLELGYNRGGDVDTLSRYIYIHGTPDETAVGVAGSHGCIRMRNHDLVRLFDLVAVGARVHIKE